MNLHGEVAMVEVDGGAVLLDQQAGRYWQLNETGTVVLRVLLAEGTVDDAVRDVLDRFDVSHERAAQDVSALVASFRNAGLVTP